MERKVVTKILGIMIILVIPILMFSCNKLLFLNPIYLKWEYSKENFPESKVFSDKERLDLSENVLKYIKSMDESNLKESELFTQREIRHLKDVGTLTKKLNLIRIVSLTLFVISVFFFTLTGRENYQLVNYIFLGFLITSTITLLILILIFLNFDFLFIKFHEILFPQGFWTFSPRDTLIQLYPERFWIDSAILFFTSLFFESFVISSLIFIITLNIKRGKIKIDIYQ